MSDWYSWLMALAKLRNEDVTIPRPKTPDSYSRIRELGFKTVFWEEFNPTNEAEARYMLERTQAFIAEKKPCLFIFDPKETGLQKDFLFDVTDFGEVQKWVSKNYKELYKYSYLITTQITNPGDGFVGTVFSDGNGKIFCETLHKPGVCNHRVLSQQRGAPGKYFDHFTTENFEVLSATRKFLEPADIQEIINLFGNKEGYFEIVKGVQGGEPGLYVTGIDDFGSRPFPHDCYELMSKN